jgi:integrase
MFTQRAKPTMSKKRKQLTDDNLTVLLPVKQARYSKADTDQRGLHHRVTPNGVRSMWAVERDQYGKQIWTLLGHWPEMKTEDAREKAREIIVRVKAGKPAFEPKPPAPDTLAAVADGWLKRYVVPKGLRTEKAIRSRLDKHVLPKLGARVFASIERIEYSRLLDHIEDRHRARTADQVLTDLRSMANWYETRDSNYTPTFVKRMKRGVKVTRDRVLNDGELRMIWQAAGDAGSFGALVKMALLTGQRRAKLISMKWDDVRDGCWHVPQEHIREKLAGGSLVLPKLALEILETQPHFVSNSHIFPGASGASVLSIGRHKKSFNAQLVAMGWAHIARKPDASPDWSVHDLRRTARSLMSRKETGISRDAAERVLGHVVGSATERIYDRDPYIEVKAEALAALAALIERIISPPPADDGKVVELAQRRG